MQARCANSPGASSQRRIAPSAPAVKSESFAKTTSLTLAAWPRNTTGVNKEDERSQSRTVRSALAV
jgi:hypothetical protein